MYKRLILTITLILLTAISAFAQSPIYITLDVSPSMTGQRYNLASYGAQVVSILNDGRKITLIVDSKLYDISGDYTSIQKKMGDYGGFWESEIWDIDKLTKIADTKATNQDVFIIGDGYWEEPADVYKAFKKLVETGNFKVTFLETISKMDNISQFERYFDKEYLGRKYKVTSTEGIIEAMNEITEGITGVSAIPVSQLNFSTDCVTFKSEMAVKSMKMMYQDNKNLNDLPRITEIRVNGKALNIKELGEPTNEMYARSYQGLMSSRIYEVLSNIPSGNEIEICFDKEFDVEKLKIYPIVDVEIGNFELQIEKGQFKYIDENTFEVCKDNDTAEIFFKINQKTSGIPEELLKKAEVKIISDHIEYPAIYDDGKFSAIIPLKGKTTTYTIESELKGYFRKNSGQKKLIKGNDCKPPPPPKLEPLPMQYLYFGAISLDNLIRKEKISSRIVDEESGETISPEFFDITVKNNYKAIFKSVKMEFREDGWIDLIIEPRGEWCDCFIPNKLKIDFYADPKEGMTIDGKYYRPIQAILTVDIVKEKSWLARCSWLLFTMIGSLLLSWFLILLTRKKRFRRGSKIVFKYPNISTKRSLNPTYISSDFRLRKKGFGAWLNRWFNPFGAEKNTLSFHNIGVTLQFIAAKSMRYVYYPKASFNESNMESINYDPDSKDKFINMDENNELKVVHNRQHLGKTTNFLAYSYPKRAWNDVGTFRFVLGIIILFLLAYFFIALILLIKSLF